MQNRLIIAALVVVALVASSVALPAQKRMIYYQQPAAAQWYGAPQRMMYVQYVRPSETHARSTQAASALVAGETVATGTYLEDCDHAESDIAAVGPAIEHGEDVLGAAGAHSAHAVAEAYPDESNSVPEPPSRAQTEVEVEIEPATVDAGNVAADLPATVEAEEEQANKNDDAAKVPRDYNFEAPVEPAVEAPVAPELPAPAPIAPVAAVVPPARRYLPSKKKVYVELDEEVAEVEEPEADTAVAIAEDEDNQEEEDEVDVAPIVPVAPPKKPARVPSARRPVAKKPVKPLKAAADCSGCTKAAQSGATAKPQLPAGTFFPIDFGGTAGGAIAIANSFSTGEGGSATSHAIAYGSPETVRTRAKPSKLH